MANVLGLSGAYDTFLYEDSLAAYSQWSRYYTITGADNAITITLVWTDPEGSYDCGEAAGSVCLVHDLDLEVFFGGTQFWPNLGAGESDLLPPNWILCRINQFGF